MGLIHEDASTAGPGAPRGPAELNQLNNNNNIIIMQTLDDEQQKVRGGITGEGQELSAEDESRINCDENHEILNNRVQMELVGLTNNSNTERRRQQQREETQTQASSSVRWESVLPVRSWKVLLVENDDSTRHVVGALLRNCGYEVVSVANGLQAWRVFKDLTASIDLVLTEVVLPCLSGIGLLSKIMRHKTCKNIPVIMMSSHDSMSIVFKCLSKGAVDFLVKPIRKNELKNLWQHVWRKCHSSSGSGSESGILTQKSLKSESAEHSDNKQHKNYDSDDIGSIGLNARDRSDNGSGTQSSWTKMAVEVDSSRQMSPWNQYADPPGSTRAQVIHSIANAIDHNGVPKANGHERQGQLLDKELEIGIPSIPLLQPQGHWEEAPSDLQGCNKQNISEKENADEEKENSQVELTVEKRTNGVYQNQVTESTCVVTNNSVDPLQQIQVLDNQNGNVSMVKGKKSYANKEMPSFEFSSKGLNGGGDLGSSTQDQNILRQSDRSAFSRYNSTSHQGPTGNVGSCSPIDNSSEAAKTELLRCLQPYLNSMPPNHSNGSNNNNDMGSSTNNAFTKPSTTIDKPTQKPTVKYVHPSSAFQPVQNASPQPIYQATNMDLAENGEKQHIQVQHRYYHYHHHHRDHNMVAKQLINHNDKSLENKTNASYHDAPSNPLSIPVKNHAGSQSLNGSASGSNHGSNVQIGSNATLLERIANVENDTRLVEKDGPTSGLRFETANATIHNRFTQREAALNKFRQKRKERCFEKKVRYQSRKKLAEQRPRIRGQFVKQMVDGNKEKDSLQ